MGLTDTIFFSIREDIIRGVYPIQSRLPSERELAERYEASRFAIRESVSRLIQSGFVETRPQSGTYVVDFIADGTIETLVQVLLIRRSIDGQTLDSLLQFRHRTETMAAATAAENVTDADRERLIELINARKERPDDPVYQAEADYRFHSFVMAKSGNVINQLVFKALKPLYLFFTEYFYALDGAAASSRELNEKLLDALLAGSPEQAEKAMAAILENGEKKVRAALKNSERSKILIP